MMYRGNGVGGGGSTPMNYLACLAEVSYNSDGEGVRWDQIPPKTGTVGCGCFLGRSALDHTNRSDTYGTCKRGLLNN